MRHKPGQKVCMHGYEARIEQWWPPESSMHPKGLSADAFGGISEYGREALSELHETVFTILSGFIGTRI